MRTYYRGHDASVTDEAFTWRTSPAKTFLISELHDVVVVPRDLDPLRTTAVQIVAGEIILLALSWPMLHTPAAYAAAFLVMMLLSVAGAACWRMRPRGWELRASYRYQVVLIYSSSDETRFGKVARALRRALESAGPSAVRYDLAS